MEHPAQTTPEPEDYQTALSLLRRTAQGRTLMTALSAQAGEDSVAALSAELAALKAYLAVKEAAQQPLTAGQAVRVLLGKLRGRILLPVVRLLHRGWSLGARTYQVWRRDGLRRTLGKGSRKVAAKLPPRLRYRLITRPTDIVAPPSFPEPPHLTPAPPNHSMPPAVDPYNVWIQNNRWNERAALVAQRTLERLPRRPLMSVLLPVYNIDDCWLEKAIASVRNQVYPDWELCIADDASTAPNVRALLTRLEREEARIKVRYLSENVNISRATNAAAEMASGEFLVFLDHDDELTPDCLLELAQAGVADPEADIIYSDSDKIDLEGRRYHPEFKPDWSPELLLSYMYLSHVFCVRRELFRRLGGCRAGFEGCQDYDFALRAAEQARQVVHIPKMLYHWRCLPNSTASSGGSKPEAFQRGARAVQEALDRRGMAGKVSRPDFAVQGQLGIFRVQFPDDGPPVTIVIPTRNQVDLLRRCIRSILEKTTYRNYRIVVIDNDSDDSATLTYLRKLSAQVRVLRVPREGGRFNFARMNNRAVEEIDGEFVLFLNNDTEVRRPEWLSQMVGHALIPEVGAVGARLLYPDGRVQHAGIVLGMHGGLAGHAFKLIPEWDNGYMSHAVVGRNYSAVTAACMLVRRSVFRELGGFDEERFAVAYNDVDFCLRLGRRGLRCVYVPEAELIHHEGKTRGFTDNPHERLAARRQWGRLADPYFNPNLSLEHEQFVISPRRTSIGPDAAQLPVRALLFSHNLNLEGAPLFLYELAAGLKARGRVAPEVFAPVDGPLAETFRRAGVPVHVHQHPLAGVYTREQLTHRLRVFAAWMQEMGFQTVVANTLNGYCALPAARQAGLPALWVVHESTDWRTYFDQFGPLLSEVGQRAFADPYQVVFVADATRALFAALNTRHHLGLIHNGLKRDAIDRYVATHSPRSAKELIGCAPQKKVVSVIGTVCERKGQIDFARAAVELLHAGRRDTAFYIVGCRTSPYLEAIQSLTQRFRADVHLIPETNAVNAYFRASDVFVCSSYNESFPRVTLEAMAFRVPVIATPVFGINEQIKHDVSGLTYAPGDVSALTGHLERLLDKNEERQRLADAGYAALETLTSYEEMVEGYERLILEAYMTGGDPATAQVGALAVAKRRAA